eukprot:GEMP01028855.1.p1 GENE.GEMP01028855.1~~GEMP01028855.1.p1  ORF type:complete len:223 (+),score=67.19 GEMP01028855.1:114-782(+)
MGATMCQPADTRTMRASSFPALSSMGSIFCRPVDNRTQFVATLDRTHVPTSKMVDALLVIRERGMREIASDSHPVKIKDHVEALELALCCLVDAAFSVDIIASRSGSDLYKVLVRAKMQEVPRARLEKCRIACEKLRWANLLTLGEGVEALKEFLVAAYDAATIYEEVKAQLPLLGSGERNMIEDPRGLSDQQAQLMAMGENDDFIPLADDPRQALLHMERM